MPRILEPRPVKFCFVLLLALFPGLHSHAATQVQLYEINRNSPLNGVNVGVGLEVDKSTVASVALTSSPSGQVELFQFLEKNAELIQKYQERARLAFFLQEHTAYLTLDELTKTPARVSFDLGPVLVTGHFIDPAGKRISRFQDFFPEEVHGAIDEYFSSMQIRLYEASPTSRGKMVLNGLRAETNGQFQIYVQKNQQYRLETVGARTLNLVTTNFTVENSDKDIEVVAASKPYCLYGNFIDQSNGSLIQDNVNITGLGAYFNGMGGSRYALFFDSPGTFSLKVGSFVFTKHYRPTNVTVTVSDKLQRQDFELEPLLASQVALKCRIKFTGINTNAVSGMTVYLSGDNYFSQRGEPAAENTYSFLVPQPGRYNLSIGSQRFYLENTNALALDHEQTLEMVLVEKDTWLLVKVFDEQGNAVGFPPDSTRRMHRPRENCVILAAAASGNDRSKIPHNYLDSGMDVGGSPRPNEAGEVKFLLTKGGTYYLNTWFSAYKDSETLVEVKPHQTNSVELRLRHP
jgi:hypothetical protein